MKNSKALKLVERFSNSFKAWNFLCVKASRLSGHNATNWRRKDELKRKWYGNRKINTNTTNGNNFYFRPCHIQDQKRISLNLVSTFLWRFVLRISWFIDLTFRKSYLYWDFKAFPKIAKFSVKISFVDTSNTLPNKGIYGLYKSR